LAHVSFLAVTLAVAGLGASVCAARADIITLDVSATMHANNPQATCLGVSLGDGCTLGGDMVIDNSLPFSVISINVTMAGETPIVGPFTFFVDGGSIGNGGPNFTFVKAIDAPFMLPFLANILILTFLTSTPGSLVGFTGGPLATPFTAIDANIPGGAPFVGDTWLLTSGSLTEAVPEPSSLLLLVSALAGAGIFFYGARSLRRLRSGFWYTAERY
jgi:hypothetical protein